MSEITLEADERTLGQLTRRAEQAERERDEAREERDQALSWRLETIAEAEVPLDAAGIPQHSEPPFIASLPLAQRIALLATDRDTLRAEVERLNHLLREGGKTLSRAEEQLAQNAEDWQSLRGEIATLRAEVERLTRERDEAIRRIGPLAATSARLRGALERVMLSRDASWTGGHDWEEALKEATAALAGEGEVHRWESVGDFIACQQCGVLRGQTSDEEVCPTPEKAREA